MHERIPFICTAAQAAAWNSSAPSSGDGDSSTFSVDAGLVSFEIDDQSAPWVSSSRVGTMPDISYDDVARIIREKPEYATEDKNACFTMDADLRSFAALAKGRLDYPRLNALIRYLSGEGDSLLIDNGPGIMPHLATMAASLGCRVLVKEPDPLAFGLHSLSIAQDIPPRISERIRYVHIAGGSMAINMRTSADIVCWTNPDPLMLRRKLEKLAVRMGNMREYESELIGEYMGLNVAVGGLLMIQADPYLASSLFFDPVKWTRIFDEKLTGKKGLWGGVIPTLMYDSVQRFILYRRRPDAA